MMGKPNEIADNRTLAQLVVAYFEIYGLPKMAGAESEQPSESDEAEKDEPYGHCDSCGRVCDGSGKCVCGGPIAIG